MQIFLSYRFDDPQAAEGQAEWLVHRTSYYLNKQPDVQAYCWARETRPTMWQQVLADVLAGCDAFVFFAAAEIGATQLQEVEAFAHRREEATAAAKRGENVSVPNAVVVRLPGSPDDLCHHDKNTEHRQCCSRIGLDPARWVLQLDMRAAPIRRQGGPLAPAETPGQPPVPSTAREDVLDAAERCAATCARGILERLRVTEWLEPDGLPIGYPFDYEKEIIKEFVKGGGYLLSGTRLQQGCPIAWPRVPRLGGDTYRNPIDETEIGIYREGTSAIIVDARSEYHAGGDACCLSTRGLVFPEAGPRRDLVRPRGGLLRIGIVVSGGIAPGINAVIAGICERHRLYQEWQATATPAASRKDPYQCDIFLYRDGFAGLMYGRQAKIVLPMPAAHQNGQQAGDQKGQMPEQLCHLLDHRNLGGSTISTSRYDVLLDANDARARSTALGDLLKRIWADSIDILYVIGGEGSMRAAHALCTRQGTEPRFQVVAIPKTMDNDILWVWQAFGFLSAVEKAREFVQQIDIETRSNPRLCIVQLFGSDSGFVVSHTALGSGACKAALIPEVDFTLRGLSEYIRGRLAEGYRHDLSRQSPYGILLLAETAVPLDVEDFIDSSRYPDLHLEEDEKRQIRSFVASALLSCDEVMWDSKEWSDFSAEVVRATERERGGEPLQSLAALLAGKRPVVDPATRSILVAAINRCLGERDFFVGDPQTSLSPARRTSTLVDEVPRPGDFVPLNQRLAERLRCLPLQHEAQTLLDRMCPQPRDGKRTGSLPGPAMGAGDGSKGLRVRFDLRLTELRNRLRLEERFPKLFSRRQARVRKQRRVFGQTPDHLRTGVLRIITHVLQVDIRDENFVNDILKNLPEKERDAAQAFWRDYRVFANEPRHLIRAIDPSVQDIIFGQRLGGLAVDNAMAGYTDFMVSQWMTEYVLAPLALVTLGRKRVPPEGIFWRSVLASTRQAPQMGYESEPTAALEGTAAVD